MRLAILSFSDNKDHQEIIYSLYREIKNKVDCVTFGIVNPKYKIEFDENNYFFNCPKRPGLNKGIINIKEYKKILRKIKELEIDTIYFESLHTWNLPLLYMLKDVKKIHVIHDIIPHEGDKFEKVLRIFNKIITKKADNVVIHNNKYINYLCQEYNISKDKIKFVDIYKDFNPNTKLNDNKVALFVGRLNLYKGVEYFEEIIKNCKDVDFRIMGKPDDNVINILHSLNKYENVELFLKYISNEEYYKELEDASLVILPYKSATQSGVVIDAYNASKFVVAFDVGALSEQIEDGISGYIVEENNGIEFSNKIKDYFNLDYNKRSDMSKNAWKYGMKKFSIQENSDKWIESILR